MFLVLNRPANLSCGSFTPTTRLSTDFPAHTTPSAGNGIGYLQRLIQRVAVAARYPLPAAFFMASTASSTESNGVVLTLLQAPPAAKAMAMAAASTLPGIWKITTTSYSPKANHAL